MSKLVWGKTGWKRINHSIQYINPPRAFAFGGFLNLNQQQI